MTAVKAPEHVAYVLKRFPRISETFIAAELLELRRSGQEVTVLALARPVEPFTHRFLDDLDVPVAYLPHRLCRAPGRVLAGAASAMRRAPTGSVWAAAAALGEPSVAGGRRLGQAVVLARELRRLRVDHVHAHFASTAARLAHLARLMGGPPYSVTAHAKDIYHEQVRVDRLAATLNGARFIATVSEANVRHLRALVADPTRVVHVPNAVDLRRIPMDRGRCEPDGRILTVARCVEKKGLDDLVRACGFLARAGRGVGLDLVGDGPLRPALEELARRERVDARFLGAIDHDEVLARMRQATVFALPCVVASTGDRDGLPTSVLEAMASGVPVITTDVNGLADAVVHGRTGLVVPQRDPPALAGAIERLLDDAELAERLRRGARAHVEACYSLAASTARLRELFAASGEAA